MLVCNLHLIPSFFCVDSQLASVKQSVNSIGGVGFELRKTVKSCTMLTVTKQSVLFFALAIFPLVSRREVTGYIFSRLIPPLDTGS